MDEKTNRMQALMRENERLRHENHKLEEKNQCLLDELNVLELVNSAIDSDIAALDNICVQLKSVSAKANEKSPV